MKILSILLMAFSLSFGYVASANATANEMEPPQQEMPKQFRKAPRHHHAMSKAMMNDLKLSDEQKAKWKEISEQKNAELKPLREQMAKLHKQERKINEKYEGKILKILTDEQQKKYESMLRKPPEKPFKKRSMPKE